MKITPQISITVKDNNLITYMKDEIVCAPTSFAFMQKHIHYSKKLTLANWD